MSIGKPRFFDPDIYLKAVDGMINADEVLTALRMLDTMPAYYRDNPYPPAVRMRERLHRQLFTPIQYKGLYKNIEITKEDTATHWPLRARLLEDEVKKLNGYDKTPLIMELAPGSMWLREGLKHKNRDFNYQHLSLDDEYLECPAQIDNVIFCAFELIEHLHCEDEIYQNYLKFDRPADIVMFSTPLYTYAGGMDNWQDRQLGHLRTYTPGELHKAVAKNFQGFEWSIAIDDTIVLTGRKK